MAFKIVARTLLELGAELISSDAVALYELVKNSVDAGSPTVRISVQCVLLHSRYQQALEEIDENRELSAVRQHVEEWLSDDAPAEAKRAFLGALDRAGHVRKAFRTALVEAYSSDNYVEVRDEGDGMSFDDLNDVYLTVGTRSRKKEKMQWGQSQPDRMLLGDKGVGRLSVMRLGDKVEIETSRSGGKHWNKLLIDWTVFSHELDALLDQIPVAPERGQPKEDPNAHGTTIKITRLRSNWTREKFSELLATDFSRMVDPFDRRRANRLFRLYFNGEQVTIAQIPKRLFEEAHASVDFNFFYTETGEAKLTGEVVYKLHTEKKKSLSINEVGLVSLTASGSTKVIRGLGPFKANFIWFNRKFLTALDGLGTRKDVADHVRQWAGGLMVFRDGFRINPYGGPDDDWLHLDAKAFARRGYKLNRQQVIGRVNISWRNDHLIEQTNREGLVDNDYKDALMKILQHVLEDFKAFTQGIEDSLKREELTSIDLLKKRVKDARTEVIKRIRQVAVNAPKQAGALQQVERLVKQMSDQIDGVDEIIEDYKDDRRKFVHLAGLGLMIELILHELTRMAGNTLGTIEAVDPKLLPGKLPAVFDTLESQLKTLQKRLHTLNPLSTARRQVKEHFEIGELVREIIDARNNQIARHHIDVRINSEGPWRIRAVKGMLIQIIENLLSNSFYWLKHQSIVQPNFKPRVDIDLTTKDNVVTITDNGPGIEIERREDVFEPFVTSKPPGQGSGLGLYIARELAGYHGWTLELAAPNKKSSKTLNTFVLDLSAGGKDMSGLVADAVEIGKVKRFAIVDDAYDEPKPSEISEDAFNRFVLAVEDEQEVRSDIEAGSSLSEKDLEDYETFVGNGRLLGQLWDVYSGTTDHKVRPLARAALRVLFADVETDRQSKLVQLRPLEDLLTAVGKPIMKLGSQAKPKDAAKADVIFLDLYLSTDVPAGDGNKITVSRSTLDKARERAMEFLKSVRQASWAEVDGITPAVILISSIGTETVSRHFRRDSEQTMARFRFVQKQALEESQPQSLLAIADICRTCLASSVIEPILKSWPRILKESADWVGQVLLDMDIADFGRLYRSMKNEGQPVDDYFKELVAGAVAERIGRAFSELKSPQATSPFEGIPNFYEPPSDGFVQLFSANRIAQSQGYRGSAGLDVQSGDLYLSGAIPKKASAKLIDKKVYAVMSPACDLMDRTGKGPAAKSLLMLEGSIRTITNDADPQILPFGEHFYELDWSWKHPQSINMEALQKKKKTKKLNWLGRLKGEHFLAIQTHFLESLGRVGLIKSPSIFEPLAGVICARSSGNIVQLAAFSGTRQFAYLSAQSADPISKQPLFFSGVFLEFFFKVLAEIRDGNHPAALKDKAKGLLLERMDRVLAMVEVKKTTGHSIQNYLSIELNETDTKQIVEVGNSIVIRLWKN